jgi:uncharacterized membrane protein YkoI
MKMSIGFTAFVLLAGVAAASAKDQPGTDWISADEVKSKLIAAGYSSIVKIEADDGHWEGEGMKDGQKHEFHVDPHTGAITQDKEDDD